MKINFLFVCDSAVKDNKLNVQGIFDSISSSDYPAVHPIMYIVVNLEIPEEAQNKSYLESFKIIFGNKTILEDSTSFTPTKPRHQFLHRIEGLVLEKPGHYDVEIFVGSKKIGETYFMAR